MHEFFGIGVADATSAQTLAAHNLQAAFGSSATGSTSGMSGPDVGAQR